RRDASGATWKRNRGLFAPSPPPPMQPLAFSERGRDSSGRRCQPLACHPLFHELRQSPRQLPAHTTGSADCESTPPIASARLPTDTCVTARRRGIAGAEKAPKRIWLRL